MSSSEINSTFELLCSPWICLEQNTAWENVRSLAQCRSYKKKAMIIQSGETLQHLYYLKKGKVKTVAINSVGQQKIVWYIEPGCIFGETPLFNQKPCSYYFYALSDCEIYTFAQNIVFDEIIPKYPTLVLALLHTLSRKVHILSTQVEDSTFYKPLFRVSKLLYLLYQDKKKAVTSKDNVSLPITQEDIADILGIHRVTVNQAIRHLKNEGILEANTHLIVVNNLDKLKEFITIDC